MASASAGMASRERSVAQKIDGNYAGRNLPTWIDPLNDVVEVLSLRASDGGSLPKSPFIVSKSIESAVGKIDSARTEAKGTRYVLKVRQAEQVNKLLRMKKLLDGTAIEIVHHPVLNVRKCVVICRDAIEMEEEEIKMELKEQKVIDVKRITRRGVSKEDRVKTATLILTVQGTIIPEVIYFGFIRVPTRNYYPTPMQCFNCFRFGHTAGRCTYTKLCNNCSQSHGEGNCVAVSSCINCTGEHKPTDRNCPIRTQETEIIKIRVEQGLSYGEAKKIFDAQSGNQASYANVSKVQSRLLQYRPTACKCQCSCGMQKENQNMNQAAVTNVHKPTPNQQNQTPTVLTTTDTEMAIDDDAEKIIKRKNEQRKNQKETQKQQSLSPPPNKTAKNEFHHASTSHSDSETDISMIGSQKKAKKTLNVKAKSGRNKKHNG